MTACANCYFGGVTIENRGPEDSPFVIVGESPGVMEIHYRKPFVAQAGKVLEDTLKKVFNVSEDTPPEKFPVPAYYTNAIMCLPRKKDPEKLAAACHACHERLMADIGKYPRKVILAVGNGAIWSLFNNANLKITKERGKLYKHELAEIGVVTAVHPAFLLRGGGNYKQFQQDLQYAVDLLQDGHDALKLPNGTRYRIIQTEKESEAFEHELRALPEGTVVAKDIETTGFNFATDRILEVGFQHREDLITIVPASLLRPGHFQKHLCQTWHNGKFDCRFLRHIGCSDAAVDDDSMLLSYTLNERRGIHDLDQVASDWLGSPNHKSMVSEYYKGFVIDPDTLKKRRRNLSDCPEELRHRYLALDIADTYQLHKKLRAEVYKDRNLVKFYENHLLEASEYLLGVERNGMLVDQSWVESNSKRLLDEMFESEEALNQYSVDSGHTTINVRSPKQLKEYLYGHLKLAPMSWSTDKDTLKKLFEMYPQHEGLTALKKYRTAAKSYGTYVRPLNLPDHPIFDDLKKKCFLYPDGRVHQTYLLHGTATSRLSCADPNMQNIPRDPLLRGMFIARPGYGILEVDYSQAELRSLAALSKCPDLMEIFLTGKDLHNELSTFLFGPNFTREDKMKAKTVNFGIVYGRTAPSIAEAFGVSIAEAQSWIDGWFTRFPGASKFIEKCRMAPVLGQTITTCFGNKKRPGVVSRDKLNDLQNESANFPHQSIASNLTIRAGIELYPVLRDDFDTHIINTVHDCIVTEVPLQADHIKKVAKVMVDKMQEIALRYPDLDAVPFKAEPEFGLRWGNLLKLPEIEEKYNWDLSKIPDYIPAH